MATFHPPSYGRNHCPWKDTILPVSYLIFRSRSLRNHLTVYDIPHVDFETPSQPEFIAWLMSPAVGTSLPPALFLLYVMLQKVGPPASTPGDNDSDDPCA